MPTLTNYLDEILKDQSIGEAIDESILFLVSEIITGNKIETDDRDKKKLIRLSALIVNNILSGVDKGNIADSKLIKTASLLLTSLDLEKDPSSLEYFEDLLGIESIPTIKSYYFYLALLGLLSKDIIRTRMDLQSYTYRDVAEKNWKTKIITGCIDSFILLVRKDNGFADIRQAINIIDSLRKVQSNFESNYLEGLEENSVKVLEAYNLVGVYHISKILVETANYLIEGYGYKSNLANVIRLHKEQAKDLFDPSTRLSTFANIIYVGCINLQRNSIWFSTQTLGSNIAKLCNKLASKNFMIDLLPSQREAIEKNLLDAASNVTIIQMPTSAGKTLLAEFSILQTLSLNPESKIVYVVPTRALMNQVYHDLKDDLSEFKYVVEKTSKVHEIDPTEDMFLREDINILITTPEKLDLLIRRNHPAVTDISLVVIDEAHNLSDGERGAKLELLLVILKRERTKARFLLLSPFLKNAELVRKWLSDGKTSITPIQVDWKPSEKIIAGIKKIRGKFYIELLPSAHGFEYVKKTEFFELAKDLKIQNEGTKTQLIELSSKYLADTDKCNLYLCWGKKTADTRAKLIADTIENSKGTELTNLVSRYVEDEVGEPTILSEILQKRVAVHHSGLTEETKLLIEHLIREKEISHVCATTTIAQGINFPISSVYIDDLRKGDQRKRERKLETNDLLNIAGRAGRTLIDRYGKVFFPFHTKDNEAAVKELIEREASEVTSALTEIIFKSEEIKKAFDSENSTNQAKAYRDYEALSAFVQYLVHLLNIVKDERAVIEIDSFFKDSLGYYALESESQRIHFVNLCRTLFTNLQSKKYSGALKFADKTGFSVPSVLKIMFESKNNSIVSSKKTWEPEIIFNERTQSMSEKIKVIGKLREVNLGSDSDEAAFSPEIVARILINWVKGAKINSMVNLHPAFGKDPDKINNFVKYLNSLTFKSSWGLSALEGICLGKEDDVANNSSVASMVYFGVDTQKAVTTRMIGVPRPIADNVANLINSDSKTKTFTELRSNLNGLTKPDWDSVVPKNSKLNGEEWKLITNILVN